MRGLRRAGIGILWLLAVLPSTHAQDVTLEDVMTRAGAYAGRYLDGLTSLVMEERYTQELAGTNRVVAVTPLSPPQVVTRPGRRRELRSDVLLVPVSPPLGWRTFRDVFEVDGRSVRDRQDRLARLFGQVQAAAEAEALRIEDESARFNISNVGRTLNVPGIPLLFLQAHLQPRFRFTLDRAADAGSRVWIVKYEEVHRPTLFRHNTTLDNPSTGRIWIDADRGTVVRTEHIVKPARLTLTVTTRFEADARTGLALPTEMREQLTGSGSVQSLSGTATYANVRYTHVSTEEHVAQPRE